MGQINIKTPGDEIIELEITSQNEFKQLSALLCKLILKENPGLVVARQVGVAKRITKENAATLRILAGS